MLSTIARPIAAQVTGEQALASAGQRFGNLAATGILGRKHSGPAIDIRHVEIALAFLAQCRKTKIPNCHSFDLRRAIGDVSVGSVIAAAVGLEFTVVSWAGVTSFAPHAMIGVNAADVAKIAG
jgi:hypothetical protein